MTQVLIVPGIGDSGPAHWQSLWELRNPNFHRVRQRDWDHPVCNDWLSSLDEAIVEFGTDSVIVAHSLGCLAVVAWASRTPRALCGALLVAPPDPKNSNFPQAAIGFAAVSMARLPFKSIVVASTDDPYASVQYAGRCAVAWGSDYVELGAMGHINASSGLGDWPQGFTLLQRLIGE